jgi:hypothetical protein
MSNLDEVLVLGRRTRSSDKRISVSSETSRHLCLSASSVMSAGSLSVPSRSKGLPEGSQQGEVRHVSARKGKLPRKPARLVRRMALSKGSEGQTAGYASEDEGPSLESRPRCKTYRSRCPSPKPGPWA